MGEEQPGGFRGAGGGDGAAAVTGKTETTAALVERLRAVRDWWRAPGALAEEAAAEIVRLRRGWLRAIQMENSCPATGGGCLAKRCGCLAEMEMLANEQA